MRQMSSPDKLRSLLVKSLLELRRWTEPKHFSCAVSGVGVVDIGIALGSVTHHYEHNVYPDISLDLPWSCRQNGLHSKTLTRSILQSGS